MRTEISAQLLEKLSLDVALKMGLNFPKGRLADLERGLLKAAREFGFDDAEACARWLILSPLKKAQIEILASQLTVGETYFFRDGKSFNAIEEQVLPALIQNRRDAGRYLRIWSAGCATGEEAYSVAILLRRMIHDIEEWNISILATDINPSFLRRAAEGVYGEWSFRDVPLWLKERYFRRIGHRFEVLPVLKSNVTFAYLNLAEDAYPSLLNNTNGIDIILCRNVLMYFSREHQAQVVEKLYRSLVNGGWLVVSPAELSAGVFSPFVPVNFAGATLYKKDIENTAGVARIEKPFVYERVYEPTISHGGQEDVPEQVAAEAVNSYSGAVVKEEANDSVPCPPDVYKEALSLYELGRYNEAEEKLADFLEGCRGDAPALALLSRVYANKGRLEDARIFCERAIMADKLNAGYCYLLGTILLEMGIPADAGDYFKRALYLDQDFVLAHFSLGHLALRQGTKSEAERHFSNALSSLRDYGPGGIVPESEGVTAERMAEIIQTTVTEAKVK